MRGAAVFGVLAVIAAPSLAAGMQPGLWEYRSQVSDVNMPGMPAQAAAAMKKVNVTRHCVTPADAAQGPRSLVQSGQKTCRFTNYSTTGGKLNATMQCEGGMSMTMQGSFTPTAFSTTTRMAMAGPSGMKMTSQSSGKLVGPCK